MESQVSGVTAIQGKASSEGTALSIPSETTIVIVNDAPPIPAPRRTASPIPLQRQQSPGLGVTGDDPLATMVAQQETILHSIREVFITPFLKTGRARSPARTDGADNFAKVKQRDHKEGGATMTLADSTRLNRLECLSTVLEETIALEKGLLHWRRSCAFPTESCTTAYDTALTTIHEITDDLATRWNSPHVALDAAYCLKHGRAMEWKISELHLTMQHLLHTLLALATHLRNDGAGKALSVEAVGQLRGSLPLNKYPVYWEIVEEMKKANKPTHFVN